jgi:hypothetical protein
MSTEIIAIASILFFIALFLLDIVIVLITILCHFSISFHSFNYYYQKNKKIFFINVYLDQQQMTGTFALKQFLNEYKSRKK